MKLDYQSKLTIEHKILEIPLEKHWISQQWYSDSFPPSSRIIVGYNDTFGLARIEDSSGKPSFIGIMDIKPHLEQIAKEGELSEKQKRQRLFDAINLAQGNFDRYGPDTPLFSTAEGMVEVTDMKKIDAYWFYHKHEAHEKEAERQGVKVVKLKFTSTPIRDNSNN